ncbi:MAG TPA: DUF488 domain-containing protein [Stellaceae bacterium]|nr:DUF488 domain-containing protein [Stellaceae bacterium]
MPTASRAGLPPGGCLRHDDVMLVHTIGHSTRPFSELLALLQAAGVDLLADIRRFPRSRTNPQFNAEALEPALAPHGIRYRHLPALGGRRDGTAPTAPSHHTLWREKAFRAYADYAETPEFRAGFAALLALAREHQAAIMCAEAVWWRCHRRIVTDYLLAEDIEVRHILGPGKVEPARLTPGAKVEAGMVIYRDPEEPPRLPGL